MVAAVRRDWPECPLSNADLDQVVARCQTCALYRVEPWARCSRWTCPNGAAKWIAQVARGATCWKPAAEAVPIETAG